MNLDESSFFEIRLRVAYFYAYIHVTFQYLATHACVYFDTHAWKKRAKDREREREKEKERERETEEKRERERQRKSERERQRARERG